MYNVVQRFDVKIGLKLRERWMSIYIGKDKFTDVHQCLDLHTDVLKSVFTKTFFVKREVNIIYYLYLPSLGRNLQFGCSKGKKIVFFIFFNIYIVIKLFLKFGTFSWFF